MSVAFLSVSIQIAWVNVWRCMHLGMIVLSNKSWLYGSEASVLNTAVMVSMMMMMMVSLSGAEYVSGLPKTDCEDDFVRILCTAGEGMSQLVIDELKELANEITQFSQSLYLWERRCRETALVPCDAVRHDFPFSARLFVKLRPKCFIRCTESVRASAEQFLERRMNIKFTQDAKLEINLILSNNVLFLGLPLTKEPISKRIYTLHHGLRPTSATAIVMHIQDGVVLDPMCGKGILLCEAASNCKRRMLSERASTKQSHFYLIGSDCSLNQLTYARDNLSNMQSSSIWDLVLCTVERTPFRAGVCDSVACDLPFGHKYGAYTRGSEEFNHMSVQRCHQNCAELLRSTLRSGGEFRLLVATRLSNWFAGLLSHMDLTVIHTRPISMGTTKAVIISGRKNPAVKTLGQVWQARWPKWLEHEFTDRKVRGSNPTSVFRLPLSRLGQLGSIPALVLPLGSTAAPEGFYS
ncbi:hypothetical protein T265_02825 [Opisthorchis viverrini]|uniref:Ribosomal RNA large subunit methyltransferase K/L-like methyltransferase domain-containing protein n=1 Tax=Opisthorchis viverrini TaxID=6198 RepID=A0A074ZXU1_OPIVI|nr:hypothetical protein T265_02825 [Opisthorchis viverrini]KER30782.1 hypothetical protein T265_02825 [Opisthorchis viverrini]